MKRRTVIKQLFFATGAVMLSPACTQNSSKASILLKNISITGEQQKCLAELSEAIIPATGTPGAKAVSAHMFTLMMVDDCFKKEDQQRFLEGFLSFELTVKKDYRKRFDACTPAEKTAVLAAMESGTGDDRNLSYFYATVKNLTIKAYTTSKFFLTNIQVYQLVPGHYFGCVPVKNAV